MPCIAVRELGSVRFDNDDLAAVIGTRRIRRRRCAHEVHQREDMMVIGQETSGLEAQGRRIDAACAMRIDGSRA